LLYEAVDAFDVAGIHGQSCGISTSFSDLALDRVDG
jgi:hypothetical protein